MPNVTDLQNDNNRLVRENLRLRIKLSETDSAAHQAARIACDEAMRLTLEMAAARCEAAADEVQATEPTGPRPAGVVWMGGAQALALRDMATQLRKIMPEETKREQPIQEHIHSADPICGPRTVGVHRHAVDGGTDGSR